MTELLQFTLFGLMLGCVYAIAAMGLVLTYTVTGVFNFAHGAVGMLAAFCYFELRVKHGMPAPLAIIVVAFIGAPIAGLAVERMMRRFQGGDWATSLVVTVAMTVGLLGVALQVFDPKEARSVPNLFGNHRIVLFDVPITYDRIAFVVVAIVVAFGLRALLFQTALGARMRAVVDDRELAGLNGVRSVFVARCSWMIGFSLAALGGILFAGGQNINAIVLTLLVLNAYGAAMIGRLTSFPMTIVGAMLLGLIQELTNVSWLSPDAEFFLRFRLAIPGIFLILAVLFVPSFRLAAGRVVGRDEPAVPTLRRSATYGVALVVAVGVVMQFASVKIGTYVITGIVMATTALSLVALTGLSGQVSLTQYMFVGLGAFIGGSISGGHSVFGLLLAGVVGGVAGGLVALPAVRLRGLHLALSTFGFALVGREVILGDPKVFGLGGITVGRPSFLGVSFHSDASFAVFCAITFAALAVLVGAVRRSWFGRQLTGVRDSELAAATLGIRVRPAKVAVFVLSGFIAGCAGALYGGLSGAVQGSQFEPINSLVVLLFAYVGGITTVAGALIAGALYASLQYAQATYSQLAGVVFIAVGAAAITLGRQPNGIAGFVLDRFRREQGPASEGATAPGGTALEPTLQEAHS
ncbi:MAG: branched-chain amino acid transport system permease protein livM [Actinomycetota bacterium]